MESVASDGVSEEVGSPVKRTGVCADGVTRTGNMWIVPPGKRGERYRYRFLKPAPEGLILQPRARALLAIIEAGEEKGGITRHELRTAVTALIPSNRPPHHTIQDAQIPLFKHGLIAVEEISLTDSDVNDKPITVG